MYDDAFIKYLAHFHGTRDYFECHEVLEERWKRELPLDRDSIWVAFIQLSVALYHQRRDNFYGAEKLLRNSISKFTIHKNTISQYGIDPNRLFLLLDKLLTNIIKHEAYYSVTLPLFDAKLLLNVKHTCIELGSVFDTPSDLTDKELIHKHAERHRREYP